MTNYLIVAATCIALYKAVGMYAPKKKQTLTVNELVHDDFEPETISFETKEPGHTETETEVTAEKTTVVEPAEPEKPEVVVETVGAPTPDIPEKQTLRVGQVYIYSEKDNSSSGNQYKVKELYEDMVLMVLEGSNDSVKHTMCATDVMNYIETGKLILK
jgi:hypothetical protein